MTVQSHEGEIMLSRNTCLSILAAASVLGLGPTASAHDLPNSTEFSIFLPEDQFTGQIMFITYIGPPAGQNVWHATADFTWVSIGGTPASNILVNFELAIDGITEHWTVTGADLGWGSGPGTYTGTIGTDLLNGLLTPNGPGGSTIINVDIGTTTGDGLTGGHFDNSSFTLELAPVPAPSVLCVLLGGLMRGSRRRR
jgi:hypothetical protein